MENDFTNPIEQPTQKPQFLKVLCILTWTCCGLLFLSTLWGLLFPPSPEKQQEQIEQVRAVNPEAADKMEEALLNQNETDKLITNIINIVAIALSFLGALQMWQLKKIGFYFYLAGELLPYLGFAFGGANAMASASAMGGGMGKAIVTITIALMIIFDLAFILMYAINLKHMNKPQTQNANI
jgi:hypothetical protein